jgi:hypothetical protein
MKRSLTAALIAVAVASASPARADDSGFTVGLRASYAFPRGQVVTASNLSDMVAGSIPLWFDLGYRFTKSFQVGAYAQYAGLFGLSRVASCPVNGNCSSNSTRFGLETSYAFFPDASFDPWVGLGLGYESLGANVEGSDRTVRGFEGLAQLGLDWHVTKSFSFGPFLSASVGRFGGESLGGVSTDFSDTAYHTWLQAGLKTSFNF